MALNISAPSATSASLMISCVNGSGVMTGLRCLRRVGAKLNVIVAEAVDFDCLAWGNNQRNGWLLDDCRSADLHVRLHAKAVIDQGWICAMLIEVDLTRADDRHLNPCLGDWPLD